MRGRCHPADVSRNGGGWGVGGRPPVGVSTGVYTQFPGYASPEAVAEGMVAVGADVYEVLLFGSWPDPAAAARVIAAAGRPVAVVHAEKRIGGLLGAADPGQRRQGQELLRTAALAARILGASAINVHVWDLPDSDAHLERNLEALAEVLPAIWGAGITVLAETVPCRHGLPWANVDRVLAFCDGLAGASSAGVRPLVGVNLDVEFVAWHGGLEEVFPGCVGRWGPRLGNVHLKDYDGQAFDPAGRRRYVNPGDGELDFPGIFAALREIGYRGPLTFEGNVTRVGDRAAALAATRGYLQRLRQWAEQVWGVAAAAGA